MSTPVQYVPLISSIDHTFWTQLNAKKLDELKLDERPLDLTAFYTNDCKPGLPAHLTLSYDSFTDKPVDRGTAYTGIVLNTNTVEEFKAKDFGGILKSAGEKIWSTFKDGSAVEKPVTINQFYCVCFADLKKYRYNYWFCFPAFVTPAAVMERSTLGVKFTSEQKEKFRSAANLGATFLDKEQNVIQDKNNAISNMEYVLIKDPSTDSEHPGWPLRNLLALVSFHLKEKKVVKVICLRENKVAGQQSVDHSLYLEVELEPLSNTGMPKVVGWERNTKGKLTSKFVDLSASMDPAKISESSVNLNLKLMRWRLLPELNLEVLQKLKVLVLGSGTLGCNVARCLLGWGVKNITMLDNGKVSYSNPVRQSLFNFDDCGKPKAETAAARIKQINPSAESRGVALSIPMPGHPVTKLEEEKVKESITELEELIDSVDVVFLLTDTRESRWLPTLICSSKHKICINSALGFDTYLVMRHGVKGECEVLEAPHIGASTIAGSQLGCYFCNDVVAPGDSTKDRTLDQMCTVTRPGNAFVAASLAVELMVSILQHPLEGQAPATLDLNDEKQDSCLGRVPHQIRGFLAHFSSVQPASHAFDKCTACCMEIISRYRENKMGFLMEAFNDANYLEKVSGLADMLENTNFDDVWEFDSDIESD
ncbi:ubiquitin-like modifier-activating enzyme ATG7 isoform X2 [Bolinopsis microptera]|uniref:ubiquitin-like modifier-activating enzyme ATG7 isoform X2 n=1 Tax=Bolinopsis microptera TaxID=2820187 RepID=UPI00307A31F8